MRRKVRGLSIEPLNHSPATIYEEVLQNIGIILVTPKNSVPLYRDFGLSQEIVDKPTPMVEPLLIEEIIDAIEEYEPRASVIEVTLEHDEVKPGRLVPVVEVEISDE